MKWLSFSFLLSFAVTAAATEFRPEQVVRAFDPITDPQIAEADEAGKWVKDTELILGLVVNGNARAYPINQLTSPTREIINDSIGGRYIAATW